MRKYLLISLFFIVTVAFSQTSPTPQNLPFSINFGTQSFTAIPSGTAVWTVSSSPKGSQSTAESSVANNNATLTATTATQTTGGAYGYATSSNGRFYVQTSSNSTNGTNQLALAINANGLQNIIISYDIEMVSAQNRTVGAVLQYRIGNSGNWITVNGTVYSHNSNDRAAGQVDSYSNIELPVAVNNNSEVQLRWATWRGSESGNSSGLAIDNISITGAYMPTAYYFRSKQNGNWESISSWEMSSDSTTWIDAAFIPDYKSKNIVILQNHTITITDNDTIDQTVVNGTLIYSNAINSMLTINNGVGTDFIINGIFEDNGNTSVAWLNNATWMFGNEGTFIKTRSTSLSNWRERYENNISNIPATAHWIIRKTSSDSPVLVSTDGMYYPNLSIENNTETLWGTSSSPGFKGSSDFPIIKGNLNIGGDGIGNVSFINENTNTTPVLVQGNLTVKSGSILRNYGTGFEIQGNLTVNGTVNYDNDDDRMLVFSGSNAQTIGGSGILNIFNFQIDKFSENLTLNRSITIDNSLTLSGGNIITTNTNLLTIIDNATTSGGSFASFIDGPIKKVGNDAFTFPIGKNTNYQPLTISAPQNIADSFISEYFNSGQTNGDSCDLSITNISTCEYWSLQQGAGSSNVNVTIGWNSNSCNSTSPQNMKIAIWGNNKWNDGGNGFYTGNDLLGTVRSDTNLTKYGDLTLANNDCDFVVLAGQDTAICYGTSVQLNATGGLTYLWNPATGLNATNIPNPIATPVITTNYTVIATNQYGCSKTDSITIIVYPLPIVELGNDTTISGISGVPIGIAPISECTYQWHPIEDLTNSTISNPIASPSITTNFVLNVTNEHGCVASDHITINVNENPSIITPGGIFDNIYDRFGNKYNLSDIMISKAIENNESRGGPKSALLCSPGYFNLYFEQNSGMAGNSQEEINRRIVICQVFSDISNFIISPLSDVNNQNRVNIWIRDISQMPGIGNPSTSAVLGLATSFYTIPIWAPTYGGIADNEVWKTIISGMDSYTCVSSPLATSGESSLTTAGTYFHGMMAFNFTNPSINWHTLLEENTSSTSYDEYSVILHEIMHLLGFASLIDETGLSKFGINFSYYSRYDLFLKTPYPQNEYLITNNSSCQFYNYHFSSNINSSVLHPNSSNCSSQIIYTGTTTQAVYTPNIFASASSLSHFEDLCHSPNPYPDNSYYVMSEAQDPSAALMKRYLKPEERMVLCDIGYNVNDVYFSPAYNASASYGNGDGTSICPGFQVIGINDGINTLAPNIGAYTFIGLNNSSTPIELVGILDNDYNAVGFECLQTVIGGGYLSASSGTATTIVYYTPTTPGIHLLRYIPISSSGHRGNITYVYVYVKNENCVPSACDLVNNGGFENSQGCGNMGLWQSIQVNCWDHVSLSPNIYARNCIDYPVPIPQDIYINDPSFDTPTTENGINNITNDKLLSLQGGENIIEINHEAIQNCLSSSIIPNTTYVLSFWARYANGTRFHTEDDLTHIIFAGTEFPMAPMQIINSTPSQFQIINTFDVPKNDIWNYYEFAFTLDANANPINYLTIINATYLATQNPPIHVMTMVFFDDISIKPLGQQITFDIPSSTICINQVIENLNQYTNPNFPGGTFSGNGVVCSAGICSFDASIAGIGTHTIMYSYTDNLGCVSNKPFTLNVINSTLSVSLSAINNNCSSSCTGSATVNIINGTSPYTYLWNDPLNQTSQTAINLCNDLYTVTVSDANNCITSNQILITASFNITISSTITNESCFGSSDGSIDIEVSGGVSPYTFIWLNSDNQIIGYNEDISNLRAGTYHVIVTDDNECSTFKNIIVENANPDAWPYQPLNGDLREAGKTLGVGSTGNVFVAGYFTGHIAFEGYNQFTSPSLDNQNTFIVKLDECAQVLWAKSIESTTGECVVNKLIVDSNDDFVITGGYSGSVDFGNNYSTNNPNGMFVAKYKWDNNTNDYLCDWLVDVEDAVGNDLAIDENNNIYLTGTKIVNSQPDVYVAKYDGLYGGTPIWDYTENLGNDNGYGITYCSTCPAGSKVLVTGVKSNPIEAHRMFISVYSETAGYVATSTNLIDFGVGNKIISYQDPTSSTNYAFIAGYTISDYERAIAVRKVDLTNLSNFDQTFTSSYAPNLGNVANDIAIDPNGDLFITGYFSSDSLDFTGIANPIINLGSNDNFVAKLSPTFPNEFYWAINSGSVDVSEQSMAISINNNGFGYVTGYFIGDAQFGDVTLTSVYSGDVFVARIHDLITEGEFKNLPSKPSNKNRVDEINVYPNPTTNILNIEFTNQNGTFVKCNLFNIIGSNVLNQNLKDSKTQIDISNLPAGIYILKIETYNKVYDYKIVKQ